MDCGVKLAVMVGGHPYDDDVYVQWFIPVIGRKGKHWVCLHDNHVELVDMETSHVSVLTEDEYVDALQVHGRMTNLSKRAPYMFESLRHDIPGEIGIHDRRKPS